MNKKIFLCLCVFALVSCQQEVEAPVEDENLPEIVYFGDTSEQMQVENPQAGATVSDPIFVSGEVPGYWFFEATAPITVVNWDGLIIGEGYIQAVGDWMTENLVSFEGTASYDLDEDTYSRKGWVILRRNNASGLPENDAAVEIPVVFE